MLIKDSEDLDMMTFIGVDIAADAGAQVFLTLNVNQELKYELFIKNHKHNPWKSKKLCSKGFNISSVRTAKFAQLWKKQSQRQDSHKRTEAPRLPKTFGRGNEMNFATQISRKVPHRFILNIRHLKERKKLKCTF